MHEAYQTTSLLKLNYQIESIAAQDDSLLVGTRQGFLYICNIIREDEKCSLELSRCIKSFSKKAIQQLEIVPDQNLLICLTDNVIHVIQMRDLNLTLTLKNQIAKTKGATLFILNVTKQTSLTGEENILIRLAVVVKRNLQLYYLKNSEFLFMSEFMLKEVPKAMEWCQETICIGYRGEYVLLALAEKDMKEKDLFPTSSIRSSEPCIVKASETTFALCWENQTVLVNVQGEAEKTKALKWSNVPVATLAWDEPYTLAALPDHVEVKTLESSDLVQTMGELSKVRFLVRCKQGLIFAASVSQVWAMCAVDVAKQRKVLLDSKQFQLALKLTEVSNENDEEKQEKIHQIQTLLAYDLFANKKFHDSMKEFLKLGTDPYDVIRLFPELLPQQAGQEQYPEPAKDLTESELETGLLALIGYLTEMRLHLHHDNTANVNASGNLNEKAHNKLTQQRLQIIDTTLLKCYLQTNDALVAPLLRLNYCHLAEAEKVLKKMGKYNELIILYQTKGQHRRALELLKSEGAIERTVNYLQHLGAENMGLIIEFASWVLEKSPEEGLKIFTEDLAEVEALPRPRVLDFLLRSHSQVVITYLEHVVQVWEDTNPLFHNALVHQYREKAVNEGPALAEHTRKKLLDFLKKSPHFTADTVLGHFPTDDLLEERAIILGRLGKHEQALAIYVRALGDIQKAVEYCSQVYCEGKSLYLALIKLILDPDSHPLALPGLTLSPKTAQPDLELALSLLEEHASKINPLEALQILPDSISVTRVHKFLLVALQKVQQERRGVQLLKGLLYAEYLQCREMRLHLQNQSVLITELNVCPVCKKRFGNQSALVRYPNGDVVHYACQENRM